RKALRQFRWKEIAIIFQAAQNTLNPVMRIADQMIDTVLDHEKQSREQIIQKAGDLLGMVRLNPDRVLRSYPFELSGGMRQRVMIAMALSCNPKLLLADEPTTALDVTVEAQILDLLKELQADLGMSVLLITHDMGVVAETTEEVAVMYAGQIVESAGTRALFARPHHPYTIGLFRSLPRLGGERRRLAVIPGTVPSPLRFPPGCRFHPRCFLSRGRERCREQEPELRQVVPPRADQPGHCSRCHFAEEAAQVEVEP
ncbi:MAG: ABC transporter ATP-binding protein, partial [Planctomycetes bacterium]|nr:ABC transporter ATP-binding protein [Planctomycetota bacterium]